ncbi:MAG: hypothetical protein JO190_01130 [Candidatus Eremiobacteraeota bacterium]|nr:hypothetical protein [Candidatus Eremiobacteraeota bacterium]MBV8499867.1 hypothetical protein [Candidatus Eremiobacteraeota bacterium]
MVTLCAVCAMLAGCALAGGLPSRPSGAATGAAGVSWAAPGSASADLLYVSDVGTNKVNVYSYPAGKLEEVLSGFSRPQALCTDASGDVFVPDAIASKIYEYQHGAKEPKVVLSDPGEQPGDCAVDPVTGTLAVTNVSTPYTGPGDLVVYADARGAPRKLKDSKITYYLYCGYDPRGNLYLDGMSSGNFEFAELPKGSSTFTNITLNKTFPYPGAVQWDGHDVAVGDYESNAIYQFKISGQRGTKVGTTHLGGSSYAIGFWIAGSTVIGPNDDSGTVMFWKYPAGGTHTEDIKGLKNPWGAVVSSAK